MINFVPRARNDSRSKESFLVRYQRFLRGGRVIKSKKLVLSAVPYIIGALVLGTAPANADIYWNAGSGTWDATTQNWDSNSTLGSPSSTTWQDGEIANFRGTGGLVTINNGYAPTVGGLHFSHGGYTLSNGTIHLQHEPGHAVTPPSITNDDTQNAVTIHSQFDGVDSAYINGAGKIILTGQQSVRFGVSNGTLQLGDGTTDAALPDDISATNISVSSNGTLLMNNVGDVSLTGGAITGTFRQIGSGTTTLESDRGSLGSGTYYLDNGVTRIAGSATNFSGNWHLNGGTLAIGTGIIPSASSIVTVDKDSTIFQDGYGGSFMGISGAGILTIDGNCQCGTSFRGDINTGGLIISRNTLVRVDSNNGTNTNLNTDTTNNGTIWFSESEINPALSTVTGIISGLGNVSVYGLGKTIFSADNTYSGGTFIDGSTTTLQLGFGGTTGSVEGAITNNGTLTFDHSNDFTFVNDVSGGGKLVIDGQHTFTISGNNSYTGGTFVTNTTLIIDADSELGAQQSKLSLSDSQLSLTDDFTSGRNFEINGSSDTIFSDHDATLTGMLSGAGSLIKSGNGTLTLTGNSTGYAQNISVQSGGLVVDGNTSASVEAGAGSFISGSGHIGDLTIHDNASLRGQAGQTLHAGTISLSDHGTTDVKLGSPSDNGLFDVTGNLHLGGTLDVQDDGGFSAGVYRIFDYGGSLSGTMTIGDVPDNADRDRMHIQTSQTGQVNLINSTGVTLSFWDGANPSNSDNNVIDGGNGTWNALSQFWTDEQGSQNGNWGPGAFAVFGGTKGNVTIDNTDGAVKAGGMQFITDGYVLDGDPLELDNGTSTPIITVGDHSVNSANISVTINSILTGSHGMDKTDAGRLILTADNTYIGTTHVDGGVLQLGNDTATGSVTGGISVAKGAQLEIRHSGDFTQAGQINGDGSVLQNGAGETTFAGDNSFTGGLIVRKGTAKAGVDDHSFGSGVLTVEQNGIAALDGHNTTVAGLTGSGKVHLDNASLTLNQDINTLFSGQLDGSGGVIKDGSGILELSGENTYSGLTSIQKGEIRQTGQGAISASSTFDISDKGSLDLGGFNSQMSGLTNAGVIRFGGTGGTVLNVSGDYNGHDGTLLINTVLADDKSQTDMLKVGGNTSGKTNVKVVNRGGLGAQTVNGIEIVDVSGQSDGQFMLNGDFVTKDGQQAVIGGAYAYTLHKGGITSPDDGDWYLRSELKDPLSPPSPDNPTDPRYSPTVPVYEGVVNNMQALNRLPTLRERVGDRYNRDDPEAFYDLSQYAGGSDNAANTESGKAVWARIEGAYNSLQPTATTGRLKQSINQLRYEIGADGKIYEGDDGALYFGVSGTYGTAHSKTSAEAGEGTIDTEGWGLHGTLTWYGSDGFYVDAQAQTNWYNNDLFSNTANNGFANGKHGFGYALSVESGKQFDLDETWSLTPQAQLMFSSVRLNDFTDAYQSRVSMQDGNSLSLRLGLAADYRNAWTTVAGTPMKADLYGIMNVYQDFEGDASIMVSDTALKTKNDKTWGGIGWGGNLAWNDQYAVYGQGAINTSLSHFGDSYAVTGTIGFRKWW